MGRAEGETTYKQFPNFEKSECMLELTNRANDIFKAVKMIRLNIRIINM